MVGTADIGASKKFDDANMGAPGVVPAKIEDKGLVFYMTKIGVFVITKPIKGEPVCAANGGTIGFAIDSPALGDAWHAADVANGGTACEDPP